MKISKTAMKSGQTLGEIPNNRIFFCDAAEQASQKVAVTRNSTCTQLHPGKVKEQESLYGRNSIYKKVFMAEIMAEIP